MEEAKSDASDIVPPPPPDLHAKSQSQSNKRKRIDNAHLHNSSYCKIRLIARQLRPHFIQVLQTPDFRNCKAAHEIQEKMKLIVDLYRQLTAETDQLEALVSGTRPSAGENMPGKCPSGEPKQSQEESGEKKPQTRPFSTQKKLDAIGQFRESYIVGGSVFGWNYVTFSGSTPVYYGVTRESFRSRHKKSYQSSAHKK